MTLMCRAREKKARPVTRVQGGVVSQAGTLLQVAWLAMLQKQKCDCEFWLRYQSQDLHGRCVQGHVSQSAISGLLRRKSIAGES